MPKFLMSTEMFCKCAKDAISIGANWVKITGKQIKFIGNETVQCDIEGSGFSGGEWTGVFDVFQWVNMRQFALQLTDQPMLIEFDWYTSKDIDDNPKFTIRQIEKTFKCR